ncbi:MAG TPA: regulatory protein RecX [Candidatus Dormibacteraeota bacterium]|nr:regulatory protein RecX [Candidatus Dormibacteraeota bacterium]
MAGRRRESFAEKRERRAAVDDPAVVLEAAARFLEARARSIGEVRRRLTSAGYQADLVEGAITRLGELGMLDDEAFAKAWVESRDRARPRGERALADELRLRGVDRTVIVAALDERREASAAAESDDDEIAPSADEAAATRLLERNSRLLARVADPRARRQRAYALLARNGFDPGVCAALAARVVEAPEADAD